MKKIICYLVLFNIGCQVAKSQVPDYSTLEVLLQKEDAQIGTVTVPENHDKMQGKEIQITYVVLKAKDTSSHKAPIIYFSGGPGVNSLSLQRVNSSLKLALRNDRDIILFDQRGTGHSDSLPNMFRNAFEIMSKDVNEKEEMDLMSELILEYKKKCKVQDIGLEHYNSIQSAKDVGILFKHLGYGKYNLMGNSYGTRLARIVQDMFPAYIHSVVLDSPLLLSGDFLLNRLDSYSLALRRVFEYCQNNLDCKQTYPSLKKDYFQAISILERKPLKAYMNDSSVVYINAQDGIYLLRRLLYQGNSRERVPELIKAFINGKGQVINDVLNDEYQLTERLNLSMLLSVEKFENFNPEHTAQVIDENYKNYPLIPVKMGFFDAFYQAGANWHMGSMPMESRKFQDSHIPTLIFVNRFDPITPPKNGHIFEKNLSNGTLLVLEEGGHGSGNQKCKDTVIIDFLDDPNEKLDISCLNVSRN